MQARTALILGNILTGIGMSMMFSSTFLKTKKGMLRLQIFCHACACAAGILVKGYAGAVQDAVAFVRNIFVLKGWDRRIFKVLFVAVSLLGGLALNNMGLVGVPPVITSSAYAAAVVWDKSNEKTLKLIIISTSVSWALYGFALKNYVNCVANIMTLIAAIVYLARHKGEPAWDHPKDAA